MMVYSFLMKILVVSYFVVMSIPNLNLNNINLNNNLIKMRLDIVNLENAKHLKKHK